MEVLRARDTDYYWLTNPFFSYSRKFGRVNCALQLNINNVFDVGRASPNRVSSFIWRRWISE